MRELNIWVDVHGSAERLSLYSKRSEFGRGEQKFIEAQKDNYHLFFISEGNAKQLRDYLNEFLGEKEENHALYESLCRENLNLRKQLTESYESKMRKSMPEIVYLVDKGDIAKKTVATIDELEKQNKTLSTEIEDLKLRHADAWVNYNKASKENELLKAEVERLRKFKASVVSMCQEKEADGDIAIKLYKLVNNIK